MPEDKFQKNNLFCIKKLKMLQRIQTVLLFAMIVFTVVLYFVPIFIIKNELTTIVFGALGTKVQNVAGTAAGGNFNLLVAGIAALALLSTSFTIINYKNRTLQLKLSLFNTFIYLSLLAAMIYSQSGFTDKYAKLMIGAKSSYGFGFFVPAICLILNMISSRFIRRDEKTVKDAFERLR